MNLNLTTATRYGLNVLAALGASIALYFGRSIFIPLVIAGLLAAILWPGAKWLQNRFRLPWFFACATVVMLLVFVVLLIFALIGLSIPAMLNDLPKPTDDASMAKQYTRLRSQLKEALPFLDVQGAMPVKPEDSGLYREIKKFFTSEQFTGLLLTLTGQSLNLFAEAVLILFLLLFLLVEGQMLIDKVRNIFGTAADSQKLVSAAFHQMAESVRSYLVWRTIINIALGVLLGGIYYAFGLKNHFILWALLTMILGYIPYIGTLAAGALPVLDAFVNVSPWTAGWILAIYMVIVTVEGYLIVPWMMGRSMDLNATTVLISCLFWYLVWGTAGLFLAMPLMAAIKAICAQVPGWEAWGSLMGSEADRPPVRESTPDLVVLTAPPPKV